MFFARPVSVVYRITRFLTVRTLKLKQNHQSELLPTNISQFKKHRSKFCILFEFLLYIKQIDLKTVENKLHTDSYWKNFVNFYLCENWGRILVRRLKNLGEFENDFERFEPRKELVWLRNVSPTCFCCSKRSENFINQFFRVHKTKIRPKTIFQTTDIPHHIDQKTIDDQHLTLTDWNDIKPARTNQRLKLENRLCSNRNRPRFRSMNEERILSWSIDYTDPQGVICKPRFTV